jgi:hypothetical protein
MLAVDDDDKATKVTKGKSFIVVVVCGSFLLCQNE